MGPSRRRWSQSATWGIPLEFKSGPVYTVHLPVIAICGCGARYTLKDELQGTSVRCPKCSTAFTVPSSRPTGLPPEGVDPVFHRNYFLLRQQHLAINEKYSVCDEQGSEILFIERPAFLLSSLFAITAGLAAAAFAGSVSFQLVGIFVASPFTSFLYGALISAFVGFSVFLFTVVSLWPLRHVTIYRDSSKTDPLVEVLQDQRFVALTATFTVRGPDGVVLAHFHKNHIYDFLRKRWRIIRPDGTLWAQAREDSILLSLLRRMVGTLYGALRANFIICKEDSEDVIGEFNRNFTILDRYVLNLGPDTQMHLDRRVALALGVMLDTGERR